MPFLLTTDPGLERIVAAEVSERAVGAIAEPAPYDAPGHVRVERADLETLLALTTIQHVIEIRGESGAATLDDVRRAVAGCELPEVAAAESFRVTSVCTGEHDFDSRQLQGAAGAVIQRACGTRVDLTDPAVNVRVDLYGERLLVGLQRTQRALDKRILRTRTLRTSIRPTTAAAMVRLAGAHRGGGRLIDPLCGTGNIPIEAKRINPRLEVHACDWDRATAEVARGTVANHDLSIDVRVCDARVLQRTYERPFDFIVTDPPYGVRLGKRAGVASLYRSLVPSFERVLAPDGRIVWAVLKFRTLLGVLEESGLRVLGDHVVGAGDVRPRLVVLGRR